MLLFGWCVPYHSPSFVRHSKFLTYFCSKWQAILCIKMESSRAGNVWLTRGGCGFFGDLWNLYLMGMNITLLLWYHHPEAVATYIDVVFDAWALPWQGHGCDHAFCELVSSCHMLSVLAPMLLLGNLRRVDGPCNGNKITWLFYKVSRDALL